MSENTFEGLKCPSCKENMTCYIRLCVEGHSICTDCCDNSLSQKCPICKKKLTNTRNKQLEDVIQELVSLSNENTSTSKKAQSLEDNVALLVNNHKKECIRNTNRCVFEKFGCNIELTEETRFKHEDTCKFRAAPCVYRKNGCQEILVWESLSGHEINCVYSIVDCSFLENGCKEKCTLIDVDKHERVCDYRLRR